MLLLVMQGTINIANLAKAASELQGFTHISTAYVNCAQEEGSHVEEQLYPIGIVDGQPLDHQQVAEDMSLLSPKQAEKLACPYDLLRLSR